MADYKPRMSPERATKLKQWQDRHYADLKKQGTEKVEFLGRTFEIPPNVHAINPMSDLIGNSIIENVKPGQRVLDMGTGCGVNAILAASQADDVVAVDINPTAVEAARKNSERNGVQSKVDVFESDLFSHVEGTFDVVIFDPPFRWFEPRDLSEVATADAGYRSLTAFFSEVSSYLRPQGRMLICFGSSGDIEYLYELIEKHKLKKQVIAHRDLEKDGLKIDYFTFLLSRL